MSTDGRLLFLAAMVLTMSILTLCSQGCASVGPTFIGENGENVYTQGFLVVEEQHNAGVSIALDRWAVAAQGEGLDCSPWEAMEGRDVIYRPFPIELQEGRLIAGLYHQDSGTIEVGYHYPDGGLALGHEIGHAVLAYCGIPDRHDYTNCANDPLCTFNTKYGTPY